MDHMTMNCFSASQGMHTTAWLGMLRMTFIKSGN